MHRDKTLRKIKKNKKIKLQSLRNTQNKRRYYYGKREKTFDSGT